MSQDDKDLMRVYMEMLAHPMDVWRARNQWVYATLRDMLAARLGEPPECVQTELENALQSAREEHGRR